MKIWSVCNQKGGVGKTTTAVTLASLLAASGKNTLLVDLDPHASASVYLLGRAEPEPGRGVLALFSPGAESGSNGGEAPAGVPAAALCESTGQPNLRMLRAAPGLAALERRCAGREGFGRVLGRALAELEGSVEHVLVDCPPILGLLMINALAAADRVLIPVQTEHLALEGLRRMTATLEMVQRSQQRSIPRIVIPTLHDRRTRASQLALEQLRSEHAGVIWEDVIPVDTRLRDAARAGQPAPLYSPDGRAVTAYRHLLRGLTEGSDSPEAGVRQADSATAAA